MFEQLKMISLQPLYAFINRVSVEKDLLSALSDKREYVKLCKDLVAPIDQCQGFYLWGCYDRRGLWTNIYLGKAGFGKVAYLRSRILEELVDERMCFWKMVRSEMELLNAGQELHGEMWGQYEKNAKRAFLKAGSTHIVWAPTEHLTNDDILRIEADLIEALNPKANTKRPVPHSHFQADTRNVFEQFRFSIHEGRDTRFTSNRAIHSQQRLCEK